MQMSIYAYKYMHFLYMHISIYAYQYICVYVYVCFSQGHTLFCNTLCATLQRQTAVASLDRCVTMCKGWVIICLRTLSLFCLHVLVLDSFVQCALFTYGARHGERLNTKTPVSSSHALICTHINDPQVFN